MTDVEQDGVDEAMVNSTTDYGDVCFHCHFRRLFAGLFVVVGGVFSIIILDTLLFHVVLPAKRGTGIQFLFGFILLISLLVIWIGTLQMRHPPVFFEVTRCGIVNYQGSAGVVGEPCFLPWSRVESIELVRRSVRHAGPGNQMCWFIKLIVRISDDWPPDQFFGYEAKEQAVFLDAFSGAPSGQKLLKQVIEVFNQSLTTQVGKQPE